MKNSNLFQSLTKLLIITAGSFICSLNIVARTPGDASTIFIIKCGIMVLCTIYAIQLTKSLIKLTQGN